ncbi:hypothetical protein DEU56DRAFT_914676 [Suillus clintonianus]|uniref:uncharacterized protein n=1 Tax=Suillus clintonianus TaxID=1904413 RepID=UPI001B87D74D|nr:uncharacterized protein DEU56DRAFT_914676 [Suillus clintonianus]KAG2130918.1 hypothetical protein DEU56DRAFT_914676 [Suillus clintonianus]
MSDPEDRLFDSDDDDLATFTFQGAAAARDGDQDEPRPFDLADVPASVEAEDALPQSQIFRVSLHDPGWSHVPPVVPGSRQRTFKKGDKAAAINLLHRRSLLRFDNDLCYDNEDQMLLWDASNHFLDFCLIVGGSIGLHALLPNKLVDHTFSIALNLCLPSRLFCPKFGKLGFDPTGCMMAIGTGPACQFWLAFCPQENLDDLDIANNVPLLSERQHGDTRLSSSHFRMAVMFMAYALSRIPNLPIYVMHHYGTDDDLSAWRIKDVSNIYSQATWDLRLTDLQELNNIIASDWEQWVADAPRSWKKDGWLLSRTPVAITCRYGQNQPIATATDQAQVLEAKNWHAERSYSNIRYISVAIATDVSCLRVKRWEEVPNEDIILQHGVVYDSPDPDVREEVDLDLLPHRDPHTTRENNVYEENGRRIPRLHGKSRRNTRPCGLLVNLETISELFSSYIPDHPDAATDEDAYAGEHTSTPSVSVYPQAFLRTMGHIQCDAVLPHFAPFISDIRRATSRRPRVVDLDDDQPLPDEYDVFGESLDGTQGVPPVVIPSACQFYNELSHRIRPSAALHDVQQGRITSALAGAYGNAATKVTHNTRVRECKMALPHQKYDNKIALDDVPRALRLENIYIIQCDSIKPEKRNGMSIYKDIIVPLARAWSHPHLFQVLRPHLCVFASHVSIVFPSSHFSFLISSIILLIPRRAPSRRFCILVSLAASQAFPQVYQWTTFGITSLLERLWAHQLPILEAGNKPRHEVVELCSVLERALAYAHTGNARVIASKLMRPLWLVQSLFEQGLPTFSPSVRMTTSITNPIAISSADWPTSDNLNVPAIASKHSQAYKAGFHIELSINKLSPNVFLRYTTQERHCIVIALVALRSYIADVKTLVATAIKKECASGAKDMDMDVDDVGPNRDKDRLKSLQRWLACDHPLGYKEKAYEHLLRCIVVDPDDFSDGLPNSSKEKLSVHDFAVRICAMTRVESPTSVAAPLIFTAPSTAVFRIAYARMLKYAPSNSPAAAEKCIQRAYIIAANTLQIQHIPWHASHTAGRGRPSRKAVHSSWVNLGKSSVLDPAASIAGRNASRPLDMAAEAAKKAQASDARAPWAVESITLQSLPDFFARDCLPDEFTLDNIECSGDPMLTEIYEWAFAN